MPKEKPSASLLRRGMVRKGERIGNGRMVGGPKLPTVSACSCVTRGLYKDGQAIIIFMVVTYMCEAVY